MPRKRKHRTLTQAEFTALCEKTGGVSSPPHLLEFLHDTGVFFSRRGLFDDKIILDQAWALDAIYAVFDREKALSTLRDRMGGRFGRADLARLVWNDDGTGKPYAVEEQWLFLSLMVECGICFAHKGERGNPDDSTEYIAPDLLPEREEVAGLLSGRWDAKTRNSKSETRRMRFAFLPPGLMRGIVSEFGREAGDAAVYWKGGVFFHDERTNASAVIEQRVDKDERGGEIVAETQGDGARQLLEAVWERLDRMTDHVRGRECSGIRQNSDDRSLTRRNSGESRYEDDASAERKPSFDYTKAPKLGGVRDACVSYAWGPEKSADPDRRAKVDEFCARMEAAGIHVVRDSTDNQIGRSLRAFEERVGQADRVFVFMSDEYVQSPHCMNELLHVWKNSLEDPETFRARLRPFTLRDTAIFTPEDRQSWAAHWRERFENLESGLRDLGESDFCEYRLMREFQLKVSDMLALIADTLQHGPSDFDGYAEAAVEEFISTR